MVKKDLKISLENKKKYNLGIILEKRFYNRGTLTSIRIPRLAKIPTLYRDWLISLKKEKG